MTALNKQALRDRYSPQPVPKCHICGSVMTIARASAGAVVYACSGCTYDDNGAHYAHGRSLGDDHYSASRVTIFESSDPEVVALLDELEHYKSREERVTMLVLDNSKSWDELYKKLEAAEKRIAEQREYYEGVIADGSRRIAELEAREATLPPKEHDNGTDSQIDINAGFANRMSQKCADAIRVAGIGVNGE